MTARFGDLLRSARRASGLSQLALGLRAGVSARHISYLEAGKARPSREMALRLAHELRAAEGVREAWLLAAGYAPPPRPRTALDDVGLAPYRAAVSRLLDRHDPYPGWALDAEWKITRRNVAGARLLGGLGLDEDACLLSAIMVDPSFGGRLVNWREVSAHLAQRLGAEARRRDDAALARIAADLDAAAAADGHCGGAAPGEAALPTILDIDGVRLSLVSPSQRLQHRGRSDLGRPPHGAVFSDRRPDRRLFRGFGVITTRRRAGRVAGGCDWWGAMRALSLGVACPAGGARQ